MPHLKIIVCDCLLQKFKERTQEICLNKSKDFGCKCDDTYKKDKLTCAYFAKNFCYCKRVDAVQI